MSMMSSSFEPPPILLGGEEEVNASFIPEEFLEEVVAAAVADAATTETSPPEQSKKKQRRKKNTSAPSSNKKRKRQQSSRKDDVVKQQHDASPSSPPKEKRKWKPPKKCSVAWCTNQSQNGRVCIRHGAPWSKKQCSVEECTKQAINGGVCRKHGAKIKQCSIDGCTYHAKLGGVCVKHGTKIKRCDYEGGCLNEARSWGLCSRHGGLVGLCYQKGCINETFWGLCHLHGGPDKDFCCFDGCSNCVVDDGEKVKLCLHRGCIELVVIGGVCDRHSDEAYLLCQPCDSNKVISGGEGEKAALDKEEADKKWPQKDGEKHAPNGEESKATEEALKYMSRGQKESTNQVPTNGEGKDRACSGAVIDGMSCIMHNGSCITHPTSFWEAYVAEMDARNTAIKHQTLRNNDVKLASKNPPPQKLSAPSKRRLLTVIGSSSTSNTAFVSLLEASGRGEVIASNANNTLTSDRISGATNTDHTEKFVVDRNCGEKDGKHCVQEGCFRCVVREGETYCKKHRDTKKTCNHYGCTEIVSNSSTFCKQHDTTPRLENPLPKKTRPVTLICNSEGCSNKALKRGFCSLHVPKITHKRCSHEGCTRFAKGRGVCITHGATIQRKLCSVEGCKNQAKRRRVCKKHGAYDDAAFVR
jgi:hypothetical protein